MTKKLKFEIHNVDFFPNSKCLDSSVHVKVNPIHVLQL